MRLLSKGMRWFPPESETHVPFPGASGEKAPPGDYGAISSDGGKETTVTMQPNNTNVVTRVTGAELWGEKSIIILYKVLPSLFRPLFVSFVAFFLINSVCMVGLDFSMGTGAPMGCSSILPRSLRAL